MDTARAVLLQGLLLGALLFPLEIVAPVRASRPLRERVIDLAYFSLSPFVVNFGAGILIAILAAFVHSIFPERLTTALSVQPFALQVAEIILASEVLTYFAHRAAHASPLLWHFHKVHHSTTGLDWIAAHRQHPIETIYMLGIANLPILALGFTVESIAGFVLFQKIHTAFLHANAKLDFGVLGELIASPRFHHWHHNAAAPRDRNFASLFPFLDRLFGTHDLPRTGFPTQYGLRNINT